MRGHRVLLLSGAMLLCAAVSCAHVDQTLQAQIRTSDVMLKPNGTGPFPAVILLHGCGGPSTRENFWAERLRDWGYLTLRVNSFAARGVKRVCSGGILSPEDRVQDVLAALNYVQTSPEVNRRRLAIMGWSHGGSVTLRTLRALDAETRESVRAAIAFYPGCQILPWPVNIPTLILIGELDDWSDHGPCEALARRQQRSGLDVTEVTYPGAHHGFDNHLLGPEKHRVEDARGGRGATIQYNPAAAQDSLIRVREFLAKHLTP